MGWNYRKKNENFQQCKKTYYKFVFGMRQNVRKKLKRNQIAYNCMCEQYKFYFLINFRSV